MKTFVDCVTKIWDDEENQREKFINYSLEENKIIIRDGDVYPRVSFFELKTSDLLNREVILGDNLPHFKFVTEGWDIWHFMFKYNDELSLFSFKGKCSDNLDKNIVDSDFSDLEDV